MKPDRSVSKGANSSSSAAPVNDSTIASLLADMASLAKRCQLDEPEARSALWRLLEPRIRPILRVSRIIHGSFSHQDLDDWMQEFYLWLFPKNLNSLIKFRGTTEQELNAFLHRIAQRWLGHYLDRERRHDSHEKDASRERVHSDQAGASEAAMLALLAKQSPA